VLTHLIYLFIQVKTDGSVIFAGGATRSKFVSLDGIRFVVSGVSGPRGSVFRQRATGTLRLHAPYLPMKGANQEPKFTIIGDFCFLEGSAQMTSLSANVTTLPSPCWPKTRQRFVTYVNDVVSARMDVRAKFQLIIVSSPWPHRFLDCSPGVARRSSDRTSTDHSSQLYHVLRHQLPVVDRSV